MGETKTVLFVEDDALIARIYQPKLEAAGFQVVLAADGVTASKLAVESQPDVVVLDLMIPKLSGQEVLQFIRQHPRLKLLPVVVFSNAFLPKLWDQVAAMGVQEMLLKSSTTPPQLIEAVSRAVQQPATLPPAPEIKPSQPAPSPSRRADPDPKPFRHSESPAEFRHRARRDFFGQIPAIASGLQQVHSEFLSSIGTQNLQLRLDDLLRKTGFLSYMTGMAGCYRLAQLSDALEAMLFELRLKPASISDSCRHTISSTVALLVDCLGRADQPDEQCLSPTSVLVVDDDAVSNRVLVTTLNRVKLNAVSVADPFAALEKLRQTTFDLVLLDINLPGITGLALCAEMRKLPRHDRTPVIFVTGHAEYEPLARSVLQGGDDLITKPILPVELTVKVVAHLLRRRLRSADPCQSSSP